MAKGKTATTATEEQPVNTSNGTPDNGGTPETPKKKKPKKERIFKSSLDLSQIRKNESTVAARFNRVGRGVKKLELAPEVESKLLGILKEQFEAKAKEVLAGTSFESLANQTQPDANAMV